MDVSFKTTSNFDIDRFSAVFSILNSFRGWGSLYNQQFETVIPQTLSPLSLFPIGLIIYFAIINKTRRLQKLFYFVLSLILVVPIIFILRTYISQIPYSSIIRDSSRFLVITSLGLSVGIALSLSIIKNRLFFLGVVLCLGLSIYPFFSGKLYSTSGKYTGQDFRLRLLDVPMETYENSLGKYSNQSNFLLPTGGSIKTKSDSRFKEDFWEIYDTQALFSPYSTGIYTSDKSSLLVKNFTKTLINSGDNIVKTKKLLGLYGINNIFNRGNLESLVNISREQKELESFCTPIGNQDSDWSITEVCHIENAYPLVYVSTSPIHSTGSILDIIDEPYSFDKPLAVVGCPKDLEMNGQACGPATPYVMAKTTPTVKIMSLSVTKYVVTLSNISGKSILVLNKTFHPGWRIKNEEGKVQKFDHLLINQLVNGWVIEPIQGQATAQYTIEFYPQEIYSRLFPFSASAFLLLSIYLFIGFIRKNEN